MKLKTQIAIVFFILISLTKSFSQDTLSNNKKPMSLGWKVGIGMSNFISNKYNNNLSWIAAGQIGMFARYGKSTHRAQVELLLSSRGTYAKNFPFDERLRTLNLDLPILYNIKLSNKVYSEIGFQASMYLMSLKFTSDDKLSPPDFGQNFLLTGLSKTDGFLVLGAGVNIKKIEIGLRALYGLSKNNDLDKSFYSVVDTSDPIYQSLINRSTTMHSMSIMATLSKKF